MTRIRLPRMHGWPPHLPGSTVIRSRRFTGKTCAKTTAYATAFYFGRGQCHECQGCQDGEGERENVRGEREKRSFQVSWALFVKFPNENIVFDPFWPSFVAPPIPKKCALVPPSQQSRDRLSRHSLARRRIILSKTSLLPSRGGAGAPPYQRFNVLTFQRFNVSYTIVFTGLSIYARIVWFRF